MARVQLDGESTIRPSALAALIGVSETKLRQLRTSGVIPREENKNDYNLIEAVTAYTAHIRESAAGRDIPEDLMEAKLRKLKADADKSEMSAQSMRGTLIPADSVERQWNSMARVIRAAMLALPSRLSQRLNLSSAGASIIKEEITEALEQLSSDGSDQIHEHEPEGRIETDA